MKGITGNLNPANFVTNPDGSVAIYGVSNIQKQGFLLIFADWCGHCKTFKPVYEQLSQLLNGAPGGSLKFPCYAIEHAELTKDPALSTSLSVNSFPTLKTFNSDGVVSSENYTGKRDLPSLLDYICKNFGTCDK